MMRRMFLICLFLSVSLSTFAQQQNTERFVRVINRLVEAMNKQDYSGIFREYDKGLSIQLPLVKTTFFFKDLETQYGKVKKVDPPQIKTVDQASWIMYFERVTQDWTIAIDDQEKIKWFLYTTRTQPEPTTAPSQTTPPQTAATPVSTSPTSTSASNQVESQPAPVVTDKQQTELSPPFKGTWAVISGGEFREGAAQRNVLQQQYAYEFSGMDAGGNRYKNDGKLNEEYVGYGKEVLAPANGTVVEVIDGVRENSPGVRNPYAIIGNAIVIQHATREYSVLAYLKPGSMRVRVGDSVTRGQVIALCGNSGNATEPVIHYHLQDSPYLQIAKGVKFYFERVSTTKEGKQELKRVHQPEIGEIIRGE